MVRRPLDSLFCVLLACTGLPAGALAAELGEARVVSHIGQQLVADIELTALHDEAAPVQVRLASADVYRGAGIAMPPVLSGVNLSVTRRGGRQFVHVSSQGAVQSEYLHLYLELAEGNEQAVRLATLWLTPDPNPAPPPAARPVPPAAVPEPKPEAKVEAKPAPKPAPAPVPVLPAKPALKPVPAPNAKPVQASKPAAAAAGVPVPATRARPLAVAMPPLPSAAKPAACPQPDPAVLKTCVALDYKNGQLTAQIGQLEDKVKVLQLAMGPARAGTSVPTGRLVPHVARPKKAAPPPEPEFPWLWLALGGAVLLAGGLAALVVRRRKAEQERKAKAMKASLPPIMGSVKNRLKPGKGVAEDAEASADSAQE
jgi:pilus assembly protein FimV